MPLTSKNTNLNSKIEYIKKFIELGLKNGVYSKTYNYNIPNKAQLIKNNAILPEENYERYSIVWLIAKNQSENTISQNDIGVFLKPNVIMEIITSKLEAHDDDYAYDCYDELPTFQKYISKKKITDYECPIIDIAVTINRFAKNT